MLRESFRQGMARPIFKAPCGFGKTVIMAHIVTSALDKGLTVLVVVPYTALINQTAASFIKQGIPQMGIIQANHPWTDSTKRLQIASVQTLVRRSVPRSDLILVDEAHILYDSFLSEVRDHDQIIGFTATPYTKGLGRHYNNLLQPATMRELMDSNYLSDYVAYAPSEPDLTNVTIKKGDYDEKEIAAVMSTTEIYGSIIESWLKLGNNEQTICFAVNVGHANSIGIEFDRIGISNRVITAKTPMHEREAIFTDFAAWNIKILINVGTLVAGFDGDVRCIIYARPTKSQIRWEQCIGRGLRTASGKELMTLIDHSGTIIELGFPEDYHIDKLCNGEKAKSKAISKDNEKKPSKCPKCNFIKEAGVKECPKCGFITKKVEVVAELDVTLTQIKGGKYGADKQSIYSQLKGYQSEQLWKGKHISNGWIDHTYKEMTGFWPEPDLKPHTAEPSQAVLGYIKHKQIKWAKSKRKYGS